MVIMSGTATVLQQFVSGLKNRNEDTRAKSAKELQHYVTTELREVNKVNDGCNRDRSPGCDWDAPMLPNHSWRVISCFYSGVDMKIGDAHVNNYSFSICNSTVKPR